MPITSTDIGSAAGTSAGTTVGGPAGAIVGSAVGGAIGGLFRGKGTPAGAVAEGIAQKAGFWGLYKYSDSDYVFASKATTHFRQGEWLKSSTDVGNYLMETNQPWWDYEKAVRKPKETLILKKEDIAAGRNWSILVLNMGTGFKGVSPDGIDLNVVETGAPKASIPSTQFQTTAASPVLKTGIPTWVFIAAGAIILLYFLSR